MGLFMFYKALGEYIQHKLKPISFPRMNSLRTAISAPSIPPSPSITAPCQTPPNATGKLKRFRRGIFEGAYEKPDTVSYLSIVAFFDRLQTSLPLASRLVKEVFSVAPQSCLIYSLALLWSAVAPATSLYLTVVVLDMAEKFITVRYLDEIDIMTLQGVVFIWTFSALFTTFTSNVINEESSTLAACVKAHFYPMFARASLRLSERELQSHQSSFPQPWGDGFQLQSPLGWEFVRQLSVKLGDIVTFLLQLLVIFLAIKTKNEVDAYLLGLFCILVPALTYLAPVNGFQGAGYTFWTDDADYRRILALHSIAFDPVYRRTLIKDGATSQVYQDYKDTMARLSTREADASTLYTGVPPPWYWGFARSMILELPLVMCAVRLGQDASASSLTTMVLGLQASVSLKDLTTRVRTSTPLIEILDLSRKFYATLEINHDSDLGGFPYPDASSSSKGMRLLFRNVSVTYPNQQDSVKNVSFDVQPGDLVVIVGTNGSGKTSLLNLLPRLTAPSSGQVLVDGRPLESYDIQNLRDYMAILSQFEEFYPVSIRDNLLMGTARTPHDDRKVDRKLDIAAAMGGSYELIQRLGYDAPLAPVYSVRSTAEWSGGVVSEAAELEMRRHFPLVPSISGGEKQRLLASRAFMRLISRDIKLLVVDEATSSLDPIAERDLLQTFREQCQGTTKIFVTHRFGHLVRHADTILCMKEGRLVQCGKHEDLLVDELGEYAKLYRAQAESFDWS